MAHKIKLLTAVQSCKLLKIPITTFLILERDQSLPPSINVGIGRRWDKAELLDWYDFAKEHLSNP